MRDHRGDSDSSILLPITEQVHAHKTKHPGSVKRSDKAKARAKAKSAKASRRTNR